MGVGVQPLGCELPAKAGTPTPTFKIDRALVRAVQPLPMADGSTLPSPALSGVLQRCSDKGFLPLSLAEYLELLAWTGRQAVEGKRGEIPESISSSLIRLGIASSSWLELVTNFGHLLHCVAGRCSVVQRDRTRRTFRSFRCGHARLLSSG